GQGTGALASVLARQLPDQLDAVRSQGTAGWSRAGLAVIDLLASALAAQLDRAPSALGSQEALRMEIHAFMEQRLAGPGLGPGMIAAAHHISLRYLYKLFEEGLPGQGVAAWIRQRRLERCQRDLLDPALAARPVSAIAARWGLADAASFSRMFRAAYHV